MYNVQIDVKSNQSFSCQYEVGTTLSIICDSVLYDHEHLSHNCMKEFYDTSNDT